MNAGARIAFKEIRKATDKFYDKNRFFLSHKLNHHINRVPERVLRLVFRHFISRFTRPLKKTFVQLAFQYNTCSLVDGMHWGPTPTLRVQAWYKVETCTSDTP